MNGRAKRTRLYLTALVVTVALLLTSLAFGIRVQYVVDGKNVDTVVALYAESGAVGVRWGQPWQFFTNFPPRSGLDWIVGRASIELPILLTPLVDSSGPWTDITIPLWLLGLPLCMGGACAARRRRPAGVCAACGYDLAGLPKADGCPECGKLV